MRGRLDFESDELFDSTSDDSGEEFIPKSGQDSSEDTDSSYIATFEQKINKMRFPTTSNMVDTGELSKSLQELDSTSMKPTTVKVRSPARKRSRTCKRSSNGASRPVQMGTMNTTKQRGEKENSESDPEQNLPDKDSSLDRTPDSSLFIPAVCKKDNGSRIYNKKQYCLYCKLGVIKMARHLERAHEDEPEVAKAVSFPKNSKERRMHMEYLRNKGNFAHNVEVMNSGVGSLVPRQQPKDKAQAGDFLHCAYCQGLFMRKVLWRHMKLCKFKPSIPLKPGRTRIQALCGFTVPPPCGVKEQLWKLLNNMVHDDVFHAVKSDACIREYGEHLYNRLGYDVSKHEYIRQKLRELGRLLLCSRKTTHLRTIEEHIQPANFMHVVKAVKELAGYSSEKHTFSCPSLALKIGYSLKKVSMLVESRANVQGDCIAAKDAQTFRSVYEARWNELISSSSLRTLQESKWNIPQLLPFTKDVQRLHSYLDAEQQDLFCKLSSDTSLQTYRQLAKVILTQVVLFNRRRAGEVSKIPLSAYTSHNVSEPQEDVNLALSDLEKRLCQYFRRIEIRGKRGRKVPVLLTPAMQQALDLLTSKRQECGILTENTYLFARPSSLTYYRGSDSLRYFAMVCGAKSPESLTSTKLRKQTATLSQVLNLSNTELDQLADFLGHDIRVHRQFYRLPEGTIQLAKISKILMALEQGRLAEFKGKSLDDINVDPEGNSGPLTHALFIFIVSANHHSHSTIFSHLLTFLYFTLKLLHFHSFMIFHITHNSTLSSTENVYFDSDHDDDPAGSCNPESVNESDTLGKPRHQYDPKSINCHYIYIYSIYVYIYIY